MAGWGVRSVDLTAALVVFARETASRRSWSQRHPVVVAVWVAVAAPLVVAGILGLIHVLNPPADTPSAIAKQISSCIHDHGMGGSSVGPVKPPPGTEVPFSQANNGRDFGWILDGKTFGGGPIPVTLYESCSWPAPPGADATGYSSILVSTVPGNRYWGGEFDPEGYANVLDTSCKRLLIRYAGGHTGISFSKRVVTSAGNLVIVNQKAASPGEAKPKTVSAWAQSVGYYVTPEETVILHADSFSSVLSVACIS